MSEDILLDAARMVLKDKNGEENGDMPIQALLAVVAMDAEGRKYISHFRSNDLRTWEARGLIQDFADTLAAIEVARMFEDD